MNPENEIDKTEALEPVETAAANVAEARGGVDGRRRPKWLLPLRSSPEATGVSPVAFLFPVI
ncbi:MAG: hypothetical protein ACLR73_09745 [Bifidobacterium pseudocatenulatum]